MKKAALLIAGLLVTILCSCGDTTGKEPLSKDLTTVADTIATVDHGTSDNQNIKKQPKGVFNGYKYETLRDGTLVIIGYEGSEKNLVIPSCINNTAVKKIEKSAFYGNTMITSVTFEKGIAVIGDEAFFGCTSLCDIIIPDSVNAVGYFAFAETPWFNAQDDEYVIVGDGVLLKYNGKAVSIVIPSIKDVHYISDSFRNCKNIICITVPDTVKIIGAYAFAGCSSMTTINLPADIMYMSGTCFDGCINLETINN